MLGREREREKVSEWHTSIKSLYMASHWPFSFFKEHPTLLWSSLTTWCSLKLSFISWEAAASQALSRHFARTESMVEKQSSNSTRRLSFFFFCDPSNSADREPNQNKLIKLWLTISSDTELYLQLCPKPQIYMTNILWYMNFISLCLFRGFYSQFEDRWRQEDEWNKQLQLQLKKDKQRQKKFHKLEWKVFQQKAELISERNNILKTIKPFLPET